MDKEQYTEYLNSDYWKETRERILSKRGVKCAICGSKENLHVHHTNYSNVGNEDERFLYPLCRDCHFKLHQLCEENIENKYKLFSIFERHKEQMKREVKDIVREIIIDNIKNVPDVKYKFMFMRVLMLTIFGVDNLCPKIYISGGAMALDHIWADLRQEGKLIEIGYKPKKEKEN